MLYIDLSGEFYDTVFLLNDSYDFYENEEVYKNFIGLFNKYYHIKGEICYKLYTSNVKKIYNTLFHRNEIRFQSFLYIIFYCVIKICLK